MVEYKARTSRLNYFRDESIPSLTAVSVVRVPLFWLDYLLFLEITINP